MKNKIKRTKNDEQKREREWVNWRKRESTNTWMKKELRKR